jgi:hypothetical protein
MDCGILQQQLDYVKFLALNGKLQWGTPILILRCFAWVAPITE